MYGRRFWSCDQHEVEKTMPMFSQGIVTPVYWRTREREKWWHSQQRNFTVERGMYFLPLKTTIADSPGTAPRWRRMDPELWGRTVRFHPCLQRVTRRQYKNNFLSSIIAGNKSSHHAFNWEEALTWRRVQSCPQGSHFHVCLCPLSHNALLHGSPSAPLSASNLAVSKRSRTDGDTQKNVRKQQHNRQGIHL